jgi:hypothetical protein
MLNADYYGLVEMVFSFGVILAILFWQLIVTRRSIRADQDRARQKAVSEAKEAADRPDQIVDKN